MHRVLVDARYTSDIIGTGDIRCIPSVEDMRCIVYLERYREEKVYRYLQMEILERLLQQAEYPSFMTTIVFPHLFPLFEDFSIFSNMVKCAVNDICGISMASELIQISSLHPCMDNKGFLEDQYIVPPYPTIILTYSVVR